MNWLKKFLSKKNPVEINSYVDFWNWFVENEAAFHKVIKDHKAVEKNFFNHISPLLKKLNSGFFFLAGMYDENTAELILTADGEFKVIPYIEELVEASPTLNNWKFTAHKSPGKASVSIEMAEHVFNKENISFVINEHKEYPDKIDLSIVHKDFKQEKSDIISNGVFIYLDNYLGEIRSLSTIDTIEITGPNTVQGELINIEKLADYLIWREKEFVEKYSGIRYNTINDNYINLEAKTKKGETILAVMNTTLLEWDSKASHPWMVYLDIDYDGSLRNGMPDDNTYKLLDKFEDELMSHLKDNDGYLNIGRETGSNLRTIFLACQDFRLPVKVYDELKIKYNELNMSIEIFKDKYWISLNRYNKVTN